MRFISFASKTLKRINVKFKTLDTKLCKCKTECTLEERIKNNCSNLTYMDKLEYANRRYPKSNMTLDEAFNKHEYDKKNNSIY